MRISEGQLRSAIRSLISEISIRMSHDPDDLGAYLDDEIGLERLPIISLPIDQIEGFEPEEKMDDPASRKKMLHMAVGIDNLPPILVRQHPSNPSKWQVIDGHHRLHAHRLAGSEVVPARVVPDEFIEDALIPPMR